MGFMTPEQKLLEIYLGLAAYFESGEHDVSPLDNPVEQPPVVVPDVPAPPDAPVGPEVDDAPDDGVEEPDDGNNPPEPPDHDDGS